MATMIKWIKKRCQRRSLPGRAPPSVTDIDHRMFDEEIPELDTSFHIYEEISSPKIGTKPVENDRIYRKDSNAPIRTRKELKFDQDGLAAFEKQFHQYKISQRPLPPTPIADGHTCPLCRRHVSKGEAVCICELRRNVTCRCSDNHCSRECPESFIDRHFISSRRGLRCTPSRSPKHSISLCSDPNETVYVPESKCSDNSSGYYSDDNLTQRLGSLELHKNGLRSSLSHNGFHRVPRMGSKAVKRSQSTNDAPVQRKPISPEYLSPVKPIERALPSCGISRSTEKAKSNSGCKRKHSIGPAEGRHARIRTGLQSYRSLSCRREVDNLQQKLNFSLETPQKRLPKDSHLRKRLQEYKQTKMQEGEIMSHKTNRNSLLYKNLVKSRLSEEFNSSRTQKVFIAYV